MSANKQKVRPIITLLTDFGTRDAYVASLKGVILGLNPQSAVSGPEPRGAAPGEFLALEGSHGYLEVACNQDNAARRLGAGLGLAVEIRRT